MSSELVVTKLSNYQAPSYATLEHNLVFIIQDDFTIVKHQQKIKLMQSEKDENGWIKEIDKNAVLNGEDLELLQIAINDKALTPEEYSYENHCLTLFNVPAEFTLSTEVRLYPDKNTELSGLYRSNGIYCTQCEAEGFRRISFAFDRPDVLSIFKVRIESAKDLVQLSNGDLVSQGDLGENRHFSEWFDPHPKPCYLFALVAGKLEQISHRYTSPSNLKIDLRIYTEAEYLDQAQFAMQSLMESIAWDEKRFNLFYDLKRFNIVAISDFNMGAMENKSLNIFNTRYVFADYKYATDDDFHAIRSIIGHEYFHNWTGNRVTCRDWFQLSLKEGLTVFRDQEFTADAGERAVERILDVNLLRSRQFPEDSGPLSHPVQPQEYVAVDNFYTATVYEKGAEIIRMYHTILGEELFQEGMKLYFKRFDGQAVRIEDFAQAMSDVSDFDFTGDFFKWYTTSGTPKVSFTSSYNQREKSFTLTAFQDIKAVNPPQALVIPITFSLLQSNGRLYRFEDGSTVKTLILDKSRNNWTFENTDADLIPVLMQNFSAPVYYEHRYDNHELTTLVNHANDGFVRYEAMQISYRRLFEQALHQPKFIKDYSREVVSLMENILGNKKISAAEKALLLQFPSLENLLNFLAKPINIDDVIAVYSRVKQIISLRLRRSLLDFLTKNEEKPSSPKYSPKDAGIRKLQGVLINYLAIFEDEGIRESIYDIYQNADCMTVRMNALSALNQRIDTWREKALLDFKERFANQPLVIDKWFTIQALDEQENALQRISALSAREDFKIDNPNRCRALLGNFSIANFAIFHAADGSGYKFFAEQIKRVITLNPQLSARLLNSFARVANFDDGRKEIVKGILQDLLSIQNLSNDVCETIERLKNGL